MSEVAKDDGIEDFELGELLSSEQVAGDANVGFGRHGIATRMIARQDQRRCANRDGEAAHLGEGRTLVGRKRSCGCIREWRAYPRCEGKRGVVPD